MINIVDDDQNIRDGYQMLLKSAGYDCNCYESAEKFLKNFNKDRTDLLLLDIHLNGMDGFSLLESLAKRSIHLSVIIITAYDKIENRKLAKKYGALAYLRKPIDSEALLDIIKYNLDSKILH